MAIGLARRDVTGVRRDRPRDPRPGNDFCGCKPQTTFATTGTLSFITTPPRDTSMHTTTGRRPGRRGAAAGGGSGARVGWSRLKRTNCLWSYVRPKTPDSLDACPQRQPRKQHAFEEPHVVTLLVWAHSRWPFCLGRLGAAPLSICSPFGSRKGRWKRGQHDRTTAHTNLYTSARRSPCAPV